MIFRLRKITTSVQNFNVEADNLYEAIAKLKLFSCNECSDVQKKGKPQVTRKIQEAGDTVKQNR